MEEGKGDERMKEVIYILYIIYMLNNTLIQCQPLSFVYHQSYLSLYICFPLCHRLGLEI